MGAKKRYAVNVLDLTKWARNQMGPVMLMVKPLLTTETVECEGTCLDGAALLVKEEISEERMRAVIKVLREFMNIGKADLRIYQGNGKRTWERVGGGDDSDNEMDDLGG